MKYPRTIFLIFVYSMAFFLLLTGLKLFNLETKAGALNNNISDNISDTILQNETPEQIQKNIADNIIRLHVIANSDSNSDQHLKLMVRDGILEGIKKSVQNASSVNQARKFIIADINTIKKSAQKIIRNAGYSYDVNVSLKDRYFPVKSYGDLIFPAGIYDALCIEIGTARGRNWWCVLFPSLCLVDDTKAVVPDKSKEKLKENLTDAEYNSLKYYNQDRNADIEYHSALYDWIKGNKAE